MSQLKCQQYYLLAETCFYAFEGHGLINVDPVSIKTERINAIQMAFHWRAISGLRLHTGLGIIIMVFEKLLWLSTRLPLYYGRRNLMTLR